ncbi:histidine phosphatase family protein [Sphingobacterium puteale]|uniref:Histidine phosphatase family protein n=1 Tax=Sphingobacterium puteale TaxID=2420510 RepID=A0A420VWA9_9SPHI|nr:histidine phosphatase family protein [Sphingobacterium puteale]RKO70634.1 histidine phosphatase family protein [Sphingobacterium puteale]
MVTIILLRHGETAYNANGNRYCGRTDIALTGKGVDQAKRMQQLLEGHNFEGVFCSPLIRARQTAEIASGAVHELQVDNRLIEIDFGQWEGKCSPDFIAEDPQAWENWLQSPEDYAAGRVGETGRQVIDRVKSFYDDILQRYDGKTVLIVGHNGINRLFLAYQLGMPLANYRRIVQENSALTLFTLDKVAGFNLLKLNA